MLPGTGFEHGRAASYEAYRGTRAARGERCCCVADEPATSSAPTPGEPSGDAAVPPPSPGRRIDPGYAALLVSFGTSSLGGGMVLPLTAVYVSAQLGLGAGFAGRYFVLIAVTSFLATPLGGRLADRLRPGAVAALGLVLMGCGYGLLAAARGGAMVMVCAVVVGAGNSLFFPALAPALAPLVPEESRRRAFSHRYTAMNVGIGLGAAIGGAVVGRVHGAAGYHVLYLTDAVTFLPLAVTLLRSGARGADDPPRETGPARRTGYRDLLRSAPILLLALVQCLTTLFGYAQFETAAPLLIHRSQTGDLWLLGTVVAVNTAAVVVLQAPLRRWFGRRTESAAMLVGSLCWIGAYLSGAVAAGLGSPAGPAVLLVFAVLFAVGESAYACSFYPLMMRLAPDGLLGRVGALTSLASNVGSTAGPAVGVALAAALSVRTGWTLLAVGALLLTGACLLLDRALRPATPARPEAAGEAAATAAAMTLGEDHG